MSTENQPEQFPPASRSFDIFKGTYFVMLPDGKRHDWKVKATHDNPETVKLAAEAADQYQKDMLALEKSDEFTEANKMKIHEEATKTILGLVFEDFDYEKSIEMGINKIKLANIATDVKSFLVDVGGMDELRLSVQRSQVRVNT